MYSILFYYAYFTHVYITFLMFPKQAIILAVGLYFVADYSDSVRALNLFRFQSVVGPN